MLDVGRQPRLCKRFRKPPQLNVVDNCPKATCIKLWYRNGFRKAFRTKASGFWVSDFGICSCCSREQTAFSTLTAGTRWATTLGNKGAAPQHIEERLHRASQASKDEASVQISNSGFGLGFVNMCLCGCRCVCFRDQRKTTETPLKCSVSTPSILVKDRTTITAREANRTRSRRRRNILLKAGRKRPLKKSKLAAPGPSIYKAWPVFRPFDLFRGIVQAGLLSELQLSLALPIH